MLFNSYAFLIFFTVFFFLYWFVFAKRLQLQNLFLLAGSYFFYAWWDWRFLFVLIASSWIHYRLGIHIHRAHDIKQRRLLVFVGIFLGSGTLILFKYLDFFISSLITAFAGLNIQLNIHTLHLIIPLGISFYTFRNISYLLDVDKGKTEPVKDGCVFLNYVSFFPAISAGPIDKASLLVPQLSQRRLFVYEQAVDGMRQILWGLFKKIVIADNCAVITDTIFGNYENLPASSLWSGAFLYTIQIYADFSGYSDMAIGIAKLLGFTITRNFDFPFFAQNIADFWRKWHISLTSWLTEYIFTPLTVAFRDYDKKGLIAAILINFTIIGIWHGANWTFILFGFLHGCYFIPLILKGSINKRKKIAEDAYFPGIKELLNMLFTFLLVILTFILFRSDSVDAALHYYKDLFSSTLFSAPELTDKVKNSAVLFFSLLLIIVEWFQRNKQHGLEFASSKSNAPNYFWIRKSLRWLVYILIIYLILCFEGKEQDFIYFNF